MTKQGWFRVTDKHDFDVWIAVHQVVAVYWLKENHGLEFRIANGSIVALYDNEEARERAFTGFLAKGSQ